MTFYTPKGIFSNKVMPCSLQNTCATYQRTVQNILDDMVYKTVECYIDDLAIKSKKSADLIFE